VIWNDHQLAEVLIVRHLWLESAREKGLPIPEPRARPVLSHADE
jgi:predicted RNase H-like HicB family nuclease